MLGFGSTSASLPTTRDAEKHKKAHELLSTPRMSQVIKLKSGEQISYAEVGPRDGHAVIWFGGPCSNRFIVALYADVCTELGLRLISFDRPGRGVSTPLRNPKEWTFASWADELTDLLQIDRFYVVANSFGTSYALAAYEKLQHKIIGALRFLAVWAPSNLPCMPSSYAVQRSLPTKMFRAITSLSQSPTITSLAYQVAPMQMGKIGSREKTAIHDLYAKEVMDVMNADHLGDAYNAYELDWLLALEVQKSLGFNHRSLKCPIKCWHGMDDSIAPLGAAMWMQREMDHFLLYAVEGATHNIHLDFAIAKAVFADIAADVMASKADELKKEATNETIPDADAEPVKEESADDTPPGAIENASQ